MRRVFELEFRCCVRLPAGGFGLDALACPACAGGRLKLVSFITEQDTIPRIPRSVGLPTRTPPIEPARPLDEPELDFDIMDELNFAWLQPAASPPVAARQLFGLSKAQSAHPEQQAGLARRRRLSCEKGAQQHEIRSKWIRECLDEPQESCAPGLCRERGGSTSSILDMLKGEYPVCMAYPLI